MAYGLPGLVADQNDLDTLVPLQHLLQNQHEEVAIQ